jgi:hypothetical protein
MASPSTFGSHRYSTLGTSRSIRSAQATSSSSSNALSRLSMRSACATGVNSVEYVPPTLWVGESGVTRAGYARSSPCSSRISRSYSASPTVGVSSTKYRYRCSSMIWESAACRSRASAGGSPPASGATGSSMTPAATTSVTLSSSLTLDLRAIPRTVAPGYDKARATSGPRTRRRTSR